TAAEPDAAGKLQQLAASEPDFLPVYPVLYEHLASGTIIDDLARSKVQMAFQQHDGAAAYRSFLLNPTDEVGAELLKMAGNLSGASPLDPMSRLVLAMRADQDITLLWAGVADSRPGRRLMLHFPGATTVAVPLDSPDNPAIGNVRGVFGSGCYAALELPRYKQSKTKGKPRFVPRTDDDVRDFPHAGYLQGVEVGEPVEVRASYVDAEGRTFHFPRSVTLFDGQPDSATPMFAARIVRTPSGALVGDAAPRLQITPALPMRRVEASGEQNGPFVQVSPHRDVPTKNEVHCEDVPYLRAAEGIAELWIRGTTKAGKAVGAAALTVSVPAGMHWKTREPSAAPQSAIRELKFIPPQGSQVDFYIDSLAFSHDGRLLAAHVERAGVVVWKVSSGEQAMLVEATSGKVLAFSADGKRVTNGLDVIDVASGAKSAKLAENHDVFAAAVSPTFSFLATLDRRKTLTFWDFTSGEKLSSLKLAAEQRLSPQVVAVSPEGKLVAVGGPWVDKVYLIDGASGKLHKTLDELDRGTTSLAFSPDGRFLLGGGQQPQVWLWTVASGEAEPATVTLLGQFAVVAWTSIGTPIVMDIQRRSLVFFDVRSGERLNEIECPNAEHARFAVSPAGDVVATAGKTIVKLWRMSQP
ncbi:MAG TPA: hypothetical protein VND64_08430, partial [Pirellulales bacterium]|nr:hypothetical protein [Pirellulales bacterium]